MESEHPKRQKIKDGYGAAYHRIYSISLTGNFEHAQNVMQLLQKDINQFSPQILARFEKIRGEPERLNKEDEFQIHITGPWNGPVRVGDVHSHGFRFLTLEGHLEAGEIRFEIKKTSDTEIVFEIESLARSRDVIVDFVYDKIPIAKLAQTEMWTLFCKNFAEAVVKQNPEEIQTDGVVKVLTERHDEESGQWKTL